MTAATSKTCRYCREDIYQKYPSPDWTAISGPFKLRGVCAENPEGHEPIPATLRRAVVDLVGSIEVQRQAASNFSSDANREDRPDEARQYAIQAAVYRDVEARVRRILADYPEGK